MHSAFVADVSTSRVDVTHVHVYTAVNDSLFYLHMLYSVASELDCSETI